MSFAIRYQKPRAEEEPEVSLTKEEFEKKYGVKPDIPEEAVITKVEETKEGYQIEYHKPRDWKKETVAGRMFTEIERQEREMVEAVGVVPAYAYAGWYLLSGYGAAGLVGVGESVLAAGETIARSIATIPTGKPELVAPEVFKAPPTPSGALVGRVAETITGEPSPEVEPYREMTPTQLIGYTVGGLIGAYAEAKAATYVGKKVLTGIEKVPHVAKAKEKIGFAIERKVTEPIMRRMPIEIQKRFYGAEYYARVIERQIPWEPKDIPPELLPIIQNGWKEFYLQIESALPTKAAPEKWYIATRGARITPMKVTLEKAITKGKALGGIAAQQQIVVTETAKQAFLRPERLIKETAKAKVRPTRLSRSLLAKGLGITPIVAPLLIPKQQQLQTTIQKQSQIQRQRVRQAQRQVQRQIIRPIARMRQMQPPKLIPRYMPRDRRRLRKRKPEVVSFARWFYKKHPVPKGIDVAKYVLSKKS